MSAIPEKVGVDAAQYYRERPDLRNWNGSYTRMVSGHLEDLRRAGRPGVNGKIKAACDLLKDHWETLHVPYQERDAARREAKARGKGIAALKAELRLLEADAIDQHTQSIDHLEMYNDAMRWLKAARAELAALKAIAPPVKAEALVDEINMVEIPAEGSRQHSLRIPRQDFFRCSHHVSAIDNFFAGRKGCVHGCHSVELKWWEHGMHRMPRPV